LDELSEGLGLELRQEPETREEKVSPVDIDLILKWAALGESESLEFKKSTAEKERTCRTLCAFANGRGGRVLLGVTPSGKPVGQVVTDRTLEELAQEFRGFEPPLFPALDRVTLGAGTEVLILTVVRSPRAPVAFRGVAYERVLNTTRTMPRDTYQRLLLEEMHAVERRENRPASGWDISRLDTREIVVTLEESIRSGRMDDPGTREPLEMHSFTVTIQSAADR
jgi:ATP-dependent DNA helicase RecG